MEEKLDRINKKLDALALCQNNIKISLAEQKTHQRNHQKTMESFWERTWPGVIEKMDSNSTRIASLEVDIAKIKTMVFVWGGLMTAVVVISVPFITYFLNK